MNAKQFFYVCGGLFLLAVAYSLGSRNAMASYVVKDGGTGPILAATHNGVTPTFLRSDGQVWAYDPYRGWERRDTHSSAPLPVPPSQIAFWEGGWFVTTSGEFWELDASNPAPYPWVSRGTIPLPPIAVQGSGPT